MAVEPSNAHGHRPWHTPSDSLRLTFFGGSGDNLHVDNNSSAKWKEHYDEFREPTILREGESKTHYKLDSVSASVSARPTSNS